MRIPRRVLSAVLVACVATSTAASAQPKGKGGKAVSSAQAPVDVETAEQLYARLDYDRANEVAEQVVKQRGLTHDQLVRAHRVLAITYAILDKADAARDAFLQLLLLDPEYAVDPNLGPKVSAPFVEARGQFRSLPSKPGLDVTASVRAEGGRLRITLRDPTHIAKKIAVGYRWTSSGDYTVSEIEAAGGTVEVAPAVQGRTRLDFYAQALDQHDSAVFEAGNPLVPKSAFVETASRAKDSAPPVGGEKRGGSILSSPVFWVLAGAAVIGGGTAAYFVIRSDEPATKAALTPQLRCGSDLCK